MSQRTFFGGKMSNRVPNASVPDVTAPSFAGIASLVAQENGSLRASWLAATDATAPIFYEVYCSTGAADYAKVIARVKDLSFDIFQDTVGLLQLNTEYFVAVRAVDGVGNIETNTASLSETSNGVAPDSVYNMLSSIKGLVSAGL